MLFATCGFWQHVRSPTAQRLLTKLVEAGAAGSSHDGCHFPEDEPGLAALVRDGHVCPMVSGAPGWFTVTDGFRSLVRSGMTVESPVSLTSYIRKQQTVGQMTVLELAGLLARNGWCDESRSKICRQPPYKAGMDKTWYRTHTGKVSQLYLQALALVDNLVEPSSVHPDIAVHHGQSNNYYKAILAGCCKVLPSQPLVYYKQIMRDKDKQNGGCRERKGKRRLEHAADSRTGPSRPSLLDDQDLSVLG